MALGAGRREVVCSEGIGTYKLKFCAAVVVAVFMKDLVASRPGRRRHISVFLGTVCCCIDDS
eukprot:2463380-Pleurochrysis_carterae.AAC.1